MSSSRSNAQNIAGYTMDSSGEQEEEEEAAIYVLGHTWLGHTF